MMKRVNRRIPLLLLLLVLLLAPVANAWCSTVCLATAISSGCAHGLQPTDDLPIAKAGPVVMAHWTPVAISAVDTEQPPRLLRVLPAQRTPLRL